jgi:glyoxylase-like metal-dependent hydrolase (beta-lactamase superfamily II)
MRSILATICLAGSLACGPGVMATEPASKGGFRVDDLGNGIYAAVRTDPPGLMVDANSLFIVNDDDVVVVDAPEASVELIAALRRITDKPVSHLVNTHWHDDHVIGNAAWRAAYPAVRFIGQSSMRAYLAGTGAKNRAQMISGAPKFAAQMQAQMDKGKNLRDEPISAEERASYTSDIRLVKHYMEVVPGTPTILPDIDIDRELVLTRGDRRIEIRHPGNAHTQADLIVWLPKERIVATGDIVIWPIPLVGAEQSHVRDWPATLDAVLALKPAIFVPGHGPVLRSPEFPRQLRALFASIDTQVAAAVSRGETLEATRKAVDLTAFRRQFAGDSKVRQFAFGMYVAGPAVESAWRDMQIQP